MFQNLNYLKNILYLSLLKTAETQGFSPSLSAGKRLVRLSRVGVRLAPGKSSDARSLLRASALSRVSLPTSSNPQLLFKKLKQRLKQKFHSLFYLLRRLRDSNPGCPCEHNTFRECPIQPLWQVSLILITKIYFQTTKPPSSNH